MNSNYSFGKKFFLLSIIFVFSLNVYYFFNPSDVNITAIEDVIINKNDWRKANEELAIISKTLIKNKIKGCGELYVYEITENEFALACTSDGIKWKYYVVYPLLEKVYLASEDMHIEKPY